MVDEIRAYRQSLDDLAEAEAMLSDPEMKALAEEGMLHLGYRRIELLESFIEEYGSLVEASLPFYGAS